MITQEYIKKICDYDPDSGIFKRILRQSWKGNWYQCNSIPKSTTAYGYLQMNVAGKPYLVHRLIWLWVTGEFPDEDIDHIDGDRLNNKWVNLRQVDRESNLRNMGIRAENTSGITGVSFAKDRNKWHAYIGIGDGERKHLGYFTEKEDAINARAEAEIKYNYHFNHGKRESWGN